MEGLTLGFSLGGAFGFLLAFFIYLTAVRSADTQRIDKKYRERTDQLVALSSHYLLTPISIIQSALSQLQDNDASLNADGRRHLYDTIYQGQQRLWILAERFVIAGEIEDSEGLHLNLKVVDIAKLVGDSVAAIDSFARAKKVSVKMGEQPNVPTWESHADQRRLKQALIAVFDNAVKFSPEAGEVRVYLTFESGVFRVTVEDDGIGMTKEMAQTLGQPLARGTSMYNFDYEGIGLGLYIAKEVLQAHGGALAVESKPKQGTAVTIEFPSE